jgi:hypothetical protein
MPSGPGAGGGGMPRGYGGEDYGGEM